jgi:hypothetical protein
LNASSQTLSGVRPLHLSPQALRERNEQSYRSTCVVHGLPESTHIAVLATESSVLVTATDIDVLAEWLYVTRGPVTETVLPWGQTTYTLHASTWSDSPRFPVVPVHVSVTVPSDAPIMHEIAAAVTR